MSEQNLNNICRICGEFVGDLKEPIEYHKRWISKYLPVKDMIDESKLPSNICENCLSLIFSWNNLYKRCLEFQSKLAIGFSEKRDPKITENFDIIELEDPTNDLTEILRKRPPKRCYKCHFCSYITESQELYHGHLVCAHCDHIFCCDICKKYLPRTSLIRHMTHHAFNTQKNQTESTPAKKMKLNCDKCSKQFTSKSGLTYHIASMHGEGKQFPCTHCKNGFPSKRVLLNHYRSVHNGIKLYKCNDCEKKFKTDSTLYAHRKTHLKLAPHKCDECEKAFKFKHHLNVHASQHKPKIKSFECNYCHRKFSELNNLTKHKKIHDKSIYFDCNICGVKLLQKRYLKEHMQRVHQVK